jgi:DNA-binding NarL/FixJ family response regulator
MSARNPKSKQSIDVVVFEQNPLAARYLKHLLYANHKIRIHNSQDPFPSGGSEQLEPCVLIIDESSFPDSLGQDLFSLRARFPKGADLCRLLMMGVSGYIPYDKVEKDLARAIDSLRKGHMWVPAEILEKFALLVEEQSRLMQAKRADFTGRQKVVPELLHRRLSNKEISSALGISDRTVKFHLEKIFDKLGVRDRHSVADMIENTEFFGEKEKSVPLPVHAGLSTRLA